MRFSAASVCLLQVVAVSVSAFSTQSFTHRKLVSSLKMDFGADIEQDVSESSTPQVDGDAVIYRGKVNEVDFCIAPADVSLSRAYNQNSKDKKNPLPKTLSLTRALNNASNRAVRRILLARCWPSPEALNLSLRLVAQAEKKALEERAEQEASGQAATSSAKCPLPRPILNILTRKGEEAGAPMPRRIRTNEEYVKDQILSFQDKYGALPGFSDAEAYLEAVLSLATTGEESSRVNEIMDAGFYDESYRRVIAVLKSVGAVLETVPGTERKRIADKLADQDICLSMVDKVNLKQVVQIVAIPQVTSESAEPEVEIGVEKQVDGQEGEKNWRRIMFWMKEKEPTPEAEVEPEEAKDDAASKLSKKDDLGAVVLSAEEPTMTRQLNSLSNIVQRALLFGGDQELLVLSETLSANKPAFIDRWYTGTGEPVEPFEDEKRAGVQYLNALVLLLREAYSNGMVTTLDPFVTLLQTYANAYERLTATLVELGSGYVRPQMTDLLITMPKPRTAQEELGRFAVWEANFRAKSSGGSSSEASSYPEDLEGPWEVEDEVGGETIGISTVYLEPDGAVKVAPPLQGLRWRLDPGPTHLDTCTFQVLAEDETVLQYRGFIDRGARLEARFSKRPTKIRGSVMFQMRDGDLAIMGEDYWKDMLPVNYKTGTTKFVMTKIRDKSQ